MTEAAHLTKDNTIDFDQILTQVEYYLSDQNLKKDKYFRDIIESDPNHALPIDTIMKCNKIKNLKIESAILLEAVSKSNKLEVLPDKHGIRRRDSKLPELELPVTKKLKSEEEEKNGNKGDAKLEEGKLDNQKDKYVVKEPLIFTLKTDKPFTAGRKQVQEPLEAKLGLVIPYCRFAKQEGNFVVDKSSVSSEKQTEIVNDGFKVGDTKFTVALANEKDLDVFWEKHGDHYQSCVGEKQKKENGKKNQDKKRRLNNKEIVFGNQKYSDINKLKNIFKNIVMKTSNDEIIKEPHHTMLTELLKFHDSSDNKTKDLKYFTVGPHPEYKESRCFFVVRQDGTREDFSAKKCLEKIADKVSSS